jgi:hypothetical protein
MKGAKSGQFILATVVAGIVLWLVGGEFALNYLKSIRPFPSPWIDVRYWLTQVLLALFWLLLGATISVVGINRVETDEISLGEASHLDKRVLPFTQFGALTGLLVGVVGGGILDFSIAILTSGGGPPVLWFLYSWYAGPLVGGFAGFALGLLAVRQSEVGTRNWVGAAVGMTAGAFFGIVQGLFYNEPETKIAYSCFCNYSLWDGFWVISSFQALIGALFGTLGWTLFFRERLASRPD